MEKNFKSLLSLICEIKLDYKRINDVAIGDEVYQIAFYDAKDSSGKTDTRICLKSSKGDEYALSIRQLAGLRIQTGTVTATWLDEFRTDAGGATFQTKAKELVDAGVDLSTIKFKVVRQLKVKNNQAGGAIVPVYKDSCYEGAAAYVRGVRALLNGKTAEFFATADYSRGMAELRDTLHASPVKPGQAIEANCVLLPVFQVI